MTHRWVARISVTLLFFQLTLVSQWLIGELQGSLLLYYFSNWQWWVNDSLTTCKDLCYFTIFPTDNGESRTHRWLARISVTLLFFQLTMVSCKDLCYFTIFPTDNGESMTHRWVARISVTLLFFQLTLVSQWLIGELQGSLLLYYFSNWHWWVNDS